ncbi:hypothetical protein ZIOFF_037041 [Zingiber officinale]|uniref:Uncharacterized protein n=1 Tax=Zingiber officinale TaxID=94328 RepID=A0A8J5GAZ1_ZINOF|nr:hypothetical protein ZIOFF_037041 [Zingiber officinale]
MVATLPPPPLRAASDLVFSATPPRWPRPSFLLTKGYKRFRRVSYIPLPKKRSPSDAPFTLVILSESKACLEKVLGDDNASWDMVTAKDLWDDKHFDGKDDVNQDDYVLVK